MKKILSVVVAASFLAGCESVKKEGHFDHPDEGIVREYYPVNTLSDPVPGSYEHFKASVQDRVKFGFDKSKLGKDARCVLDKQAKFFNKFLSVEILIEGHCDERGTREYNLALGERRAEAVKLYLAGKGVDAKRIKIVSYGKERPQIEGDHENNRVAICVIQ